MNQIPTREQWNKQTNQKMDLFLVFSSLGPALEWDWYKTSSTPLEKNEFCISTQQLSITNNVLVKGCTLCLLLCTFLIIVFLSVLNLWESCVYCHSLCQFTYVSVLFCLTVSLESSANSGSYDLSTRNFWSIFLNLDGRVLMKIT